MKIIENVYLVPKVVANPFLISDLDGLTIDVGVPFSEKKILAYIASLDKSPHDLKRPTKPRLAGYSMGTMSSTCTPANYAGAEPAGRLGALRARFF